MNCIFRICLMMLFISLTSIYTSDVLSAYSGFCGKDDDCVSKRADDLIKPKGSGTKHNKNVTATETLLGMTRKDNKNGNQENIKELVTTTTSKTARRSLKSILSSLFSRK